MSVARISAAMSRRTQIALVCVGLLVLAAAGYFVLVSPKRAKAHDLRAQTAQVQAQLAASRTTAFGKALPAVKSAAVFRLAQAIPDDVAMANVILELNELAVGSGISFDEITPEAPTDDSNFEVHPVTVVFTGNFYSLSDFLLRVRNLVRVHNGKLISKGRMFAVSDVAFSEATQKFPYLTAKLTVDAFVLGGAAAPAGTAVPSTTASTTTPAPAQPSAAASESSTTPPS